MMEYGDRVGDQICPYCHEPVGTRNIHYEDQQFSHKKCHDLVLVQFREAGEKARLALLEAEAEARAKEVVARFGFTPALRLDHGEPLSPVSSKDFIPTAVQDVDTKLRGFQYNWQGNPQFWPKE